MSKKIAVAALFTSFAVILSYIESFIPVIGIPGVKLGLANMVILVSLDLLGRKEAFLINFVRILVIGFMFSNLFNIIYSIAGAVFSFAVMLCAKKMKLSIITVGILGGVFHNIGQLIVAGFVVDTYSVFYYVPVLIFSGIITGTFIGILSRIVYNRVGNYVLKYIKE